MSSLAGLLGVFVEVVVLLALAVAVASPRVGGAVIVVSIVAIIATRHLWSKQGDGSTAGQDTGGTTTEVDRDTVGRDLEGRQRPGLVA